MNKFLFQRYRHFPKGGWSPLGIFCVDSTCVSSSSSSSLLSSVSFCKLTSQRMWNGSPYAKSSRQPSLLSTRHLSSFTSKASASPRCLSNFQSLPLPSSTLLSRSVRRYELFQKNQLSINVSSESPFNRGRKVHTKSMSSSPNSQTSGNPQGTSFEMVDKHLLTLQSGDETRTLHHLWLRDFCRCEACYNHKTNQKNITINPFKQELGIREVVLDNDDKDLVIQWKDGHVSKYDIKWLFENSYNKKTGPRTERILWDGETIRSKGIPAVSFKDHMETEEGLRQTLRNLVQYGFSLINEAPVSLEGTHTATEKVAPVQHTLFGGLWQFTADDSRSDTAYASCYLGAHTDNTYLEKPAGIQVFQCLGHDGQGGETLLVDGFHSVEMVRRTSPEVIRFLSTNFVPQEYKEPPYKNGGPGYHMYTLHPVIKLNPTTGECLHLRFNPYDRAPLTTISPEKTEKFYRSYQILYDAIADPKGEFWLKLKPGSILLIDNWRVMHGRAAFDGKRVMCGCYLDRDEWQSKARMMGLALSL